MKIAPALPDEVARLHRLAASGVLGSSADPRFDRIVRLAASLFNVPTALISLVDRDRQWFKARVGMLATETPRDISFCGHAIAAKARQAPSPTRGARPTPVRAPLRAIQRRSAGLTV